MRNFDYSCLKNRAWDNEIINYLSQIHELKGRQALYLRQKPDELDRLIEIAKVQSTESSNAIEGIRTTDTRLRQLMSEKTAPRTRDEKEIAGYRDALNTVHENFEYIPLEPNYVLQLHKIMLPTARSAARLRMCKTISPRPMARANSLCCSRRLRRMKRRMRCARFARRTILPWARAVSIRC